MPAQEPLASVPSGENATVVTLTGPLCGRIVRSNRAVRASTTSTRASSVATATVEPSRDTATALPYACRLIGLPPTSRRSRQIASCPTRGGGPPVVVLVPSQPATAATTCPPAPVATELNCPWFESPCRA